MPSSSPKFFYARSSQPSTRRSTVLIITCCLIIGITGFIIGLTSLFFASPISTSKCRSSTSPSRSIRVVWDRLNGVAGSGNGNNVVGDQRKKVMGFVGIQTGFDSAGRRRSLRQTWMPSDAQGLQRLEEATGLAVRFVIGWTKNEAKMAELQKEIVEYDDFIRLDIEEEYSKLPYKTLAFFKAAYALYNSEFYVKADDDIYLRPDRLSLLLVKERSHPQTYLGCMKKGQVFSDPNIKWYEPLSYMLGNEYFLHAYGPIYALSTDVVTSLAALHNNSFRMFSNEDVTIGSWMLAMNVNHENNLELCSPECTESSIAVWDIPKCSGLCSPEKRLLELHQMDICSKSPTLASDDD